MKLVLPLLAILTICCAGCHQQADAAGRRSAVATTNTTTTMATTTATTQASPPATTQEGAMKKPLLLREANLPARYPPPGPVGQVIVKTYPPTRMAMVKSNSLDQQPAAGQNQMFRVLFNHIKQEKIAMTAPVVMEYEDAGSAYAAQPSMMAFLYADTDIGAPGADQAVNVVDLPAITVASVGVRGNYNDAHLQEGLRQIQDWLDASDGYTIAGPPRYLGYNSPFVPWFLRYGEVQVPIMTKNP